MNRTFVAHSPMGEQLEFRSLEGSEQISRLFEHRVRLISQSASLSAKALLGKDMSIEIDLTTKIGGGAKRFISGQVVQFTYIGRDGDFYSYEALLRPWLWHATRRSDFKIFQFKKVPDIIQEVLGPYGYNLNVGSVMATLVGQTQTAKIGSEKTTTVGKKYALTVGGGGGGGNTSKIEMDDSTIKLTVGKSTLTMKADGTIVLNGKEIDVVGSDHIGIDSKRIDLN